MNAVRNFLNSPWYYVYVVVVGMALFAFVTWLLNDEINWATVILVGLGCGVGSVIGRRWRARRNDNDAPAPLH